MKEKKSIITHMAHRFKHNHHVVPQNYASLHNTLISLSSIVVSKHSMAPIVLITLLPILRAFASPMPDGDVDYNLLPARGFVQPISRSLRQGSPVANKTSSISLFDSSYAVNSRFTQLVHRA